MAARSNIFPAFITDEYRPGSGFADFQREATAAASRFERQFEVATADVAAMVKRAMTLPRTEAGALNLGTAQFQQAAAQAQQHAAALRQVATAAERLALSTGDTSAATRAYVTAARAAAIEAEQAARAAGQEATAMDRLQRELIEVQRASGGAAAGARGLALANSQVAQSAGLQRMGMIGVGQQLQDVIVGMQSGQRATTVFAQQMPQLAFAMSNMGGAAGKVGTLLAGPWGVAVFGAAAAVGFLTRGLFENEDASNAAKAGASGLSDAQSVLGEMFDLTSGKLEHQNELLILNARLTANNLRAEALKQRQSADDTFASAGSRSILALLNAGASMGGQAEAIGSGAKPIDLFGPLGGRARAQSQLVRDLQAGRITKTEAFQRADKLDYSGLSVTKQELEQAIIDSASADAKERISALIDQSLDAGELAPGLRRDGRQKKPKKPPSTVSRDEFGRDTADRIQEIGARFSRVPPQVQAVTKAVHDLDDLIDDLARKKPLGFEKMVADAEATKAIVKEGINVPFREYLEDQVAAYETQQLVNTGRETEARALQVIASLQERVGTLSDEQKAAITGTVAALERQAQATQILRDRQQAYLTAVDQVRGNIEETIAGLRTQGLASLGDFTAGIMRSFDQLNATVITNNLFGGAFREIEDWISGKDKVKAANDDYVSTIDVARLALAKLAAQAETAANAVAGPGGTASTAAADNLAKVMAEIQTITVTGSRLNPAAMWTKVGTSIATGLLGAKIGEKIGSQVGSALEGASYGQTASAMLYGSKGNSTGAAIGGALGNVAGKALGKALGSSLGALGSAAGPIGSIVGGLAGSMLGGLLAGHKTGSSTIGVGADGKLMVASQTGNSSKFRQASGGAADSAIATVEKVAEALGGVLTGVGSVSIGIRDGKYRVDPSGSGATKKSRGAIDFGEDAEAAVRFATMDLIRDGIIGGLRASTQRLLQNGKDLDIALDKALKFESVFTRLKQRLDPVGAALDAINKEFENLKRIFTEAGASAEEFADLEKLYALERADAIKQAGEQMTSALKGLLQSLTIGNDALSLRDRLAAAEAAYDPLAAQVAGGGNVDYDAFAEAAQNMLEIQRQLYGSQDEYFASLAEVTALTTQALNGQQEKLDAGSTAVVGELTGLREDLNGQLDALNQNVGVLISLQSAGASSAGASLELPAYNF